MFPLMAGLFAISRPLIVLLLTDKWVESVQFMQILCVSQALNTISRANLQAMKALGRSDVTLKLEFIKKPVYLVMLLISIEYGVHAIAVSMMIYSFLGTGINMMPNLSLLNYSIKEQLLDLAPATILSTILCMIVLGIGNFPLSPIILLVIQCVVGASFYIGMSVLFKVDSFQYLYGYAKGFIRGRINGRKIY